jgi:PhoPQ-activated pathogenicity-related protein
MRMRTIGLATIGFATLLATTTVQAGLDEYVQRPDPAFTWTVEENHTTPHGAFYTLRLTSQVWQGFTWKHWMRVYEPKDLKYQDTVLLFLTGRDNSDRPRPEDAERGFELAQLCGARCAVLYQVPNQPLNLNGDKSEDALIAETFLRYLDTKDDDWPLLFPMVKSAVRAMDAVQGLVKSKGRPAVTRFVVTGASKRGWTTWLTAAVDKRVVAIAPMVIPTLNMKAQNKHQIEVWGKYSEQIKDYSQTGLTEKIDTPDGTQLWKMIDPYSYRDRLRMPKLLINGTNDRYWTLDSLNVFWDDLKGPKNVVYLPNAGHGLDQHRDYATHGIAALFRATMAGRSLPKIVITDRSEGEHGPLRFGVGSSPPPKSAQLWVAHSETRDFRESKWQAEAFNVVDKERGTWWFSSEKARPEKGGIALLADFTYEIDGLPYHLSSLIWWPDPKAYKPETQPSPESAKAQVPAGAP